MNIDAFTYPNTSFDCTRSQDYQPVTFVTTDNEIAGYVCLLTRLFDPVGYQNIILYPGARTRLLQAFIAYITHDRLDGDTHQLGGYQSPLGKVG